MPILYTSGLKAYTRNLFPTCVILAKKFEIPRNIGDRSRIRAICIKVDLSAMPGKICGARNGMKINPRMLAATMSSEKKEKIVLIKYFVSSVDFSSRYV